MSDFQNKQSINETSSFNTYWAYSFINNSLFYPLVPHQYYDYYNRFVRRYLYWFDGYVPYFHKSDSGIMSTRLAYTLCHSLADLINGGTLMFDNPEELSSKKLSYNSRDKDGSDALEFVEKWSDDVDLPNKNGTTIEFALAAGDSVIKLNSDGETLYPIPLRKDSYFLDVDFRGKVTAFTGMNYSYARMNQVGDTTAQQTEDYFYILEERKYDDNGKPIYRIFAKAGYGNLTTNKAIDFRKVNELKWEELPKDFRKSIKSEYPNVKLGEWYDLPLPTIGIYQYKNTNNVSFLPQVPFGESLLSNLEPYLQSFDFYKSASMTDQSLGRGKVLVPKGLQGRQGSAGENVAPNHYRALGQEMYNLQEYVDPSQQKPLSIQFELRAKDWADIRTNILQDISIQIGISVRTIASFLEDGSEKATAREISVDDKTSIFVENKRTLFRKPLNQMLQDVLTFYGFEDEIKVRYSRVGLVNLNDMVTQTTTLWNAKLGDRKTLMSMIYVDKNDRQIDEMITKIEEYEEKQAERQMQQQEKKQELAGTTDEKYEQQNNNDINHIKKEE